MRFSKSCVGGNLYLQMLTLKKGSKKKKENRDSCLLNNLQIRGQNDSSKEHILLDLIPEPSDNLRERLQSEKQTTATNKI